MTTTGKLTPRLTVSVPDESNLRAVLTDDNGEQVLVTIVQLKALGLIVEALTGSKPSIPELTQLIAAFQQSAKPASIMAV